MIDYIYEHPSISFVDSCIHWKIPAFNEKRLVHNHPNAIGCTTKRKMIIVFLFYKFVFYTDVMQTRSWCKDIGYARLHMGSCSHSSLERTTPLNLSTVYPLIKVSHLPWPTLHCHAFTSLLVLLNFPKFGCRNRHEFAINFDLTIWMIKMGIEKICWPISKIVAWLLALKAFTHLTHPAVWICTTCLGGTPLIILSTRIYTFHWVFT